MNSSEIIGTPILIGNLQVAEFDFEKEFSWIKDKILELTNSNYWSSTEHVGFKAAWIQRLSNGNQNWVDNQYPARVRAVKLNK